MSERFWKKVDRSGDCWLWSAAKSTDGYGNFYDQGKTWLAHRYSWMLKFKEIPEGILVLHKCDVPACVNPDHLYLGNQFDNMRDMSLKGRARGGSLGLKGERNHKAKLTQLAVIEMRRRFTEGVTRAELAAMYGVTYGHVSNLIRGIGWRVDHV